MSIVRIFLYIILAALFFALAAYAVKNSNAEYNGDCVRDSAYEYGKYQINNCF
jgi:hypothetical protein